MASVGARAWLGLSVVCLGALVGPFDTTVNTAFPVITEAFGIARRDIQWVVIAYVLAQSSCALVFGYVGDRIGHRKVFAAGLAACAVSHAAVAVSPDFATFVAMRALQGASVGLTLACAPALATLMFPAEAKGRVLGLYAACASVGMAAAPWLGGLLLEAWGWPGVYWFRVPLVLCALALIWLVPVIPVTPGALPGRFDWAGAAGLSLVPGCLVLAIAGLARPQPAVWAWLLLAAGAFGVVLFVRHESRAAHPVLRMAPFRSPAFSSIQAASIVVNFACFGNLVVLPYVLTHVFGVDIVHAGLMLSAYPLGAVLGSLLCGRLSRLHGAARLMIFGMATAACGLATTAIAIGAGHAPGLLVAGMLLSGLGLGLFSVSYMDETTSLLRVEERGVAGSLVNVTRLLGVVLGATGISRLHEASEEASVTFAWLAGGLLAVLPLLAWGIQGARGRINASGRPNP